MLKKKEIEELRDKYFFGFGYIPEKVLGKDRNFFRSVASYILGKVLELPEQEENYDERKKD